MSQTKAQLISDLVQALNFTGTASAPANGAFLSATNTLALATNSAQRLTIKSDGGVAVGTTDLTTVGSPNKNFVVGSTTNAQEVATTLNVMEGTNNRRVKFFLDDDDGVFGIDSTASTGVAPFVIRMAQSEKLRIDQSGNVGIGTTPEEIFHIKGSSETTGSRDGVLLQHSTASNAADNGLPLVWSGYISASNTNYGLASICGRKENSTDNNGAAYLQFGTGNGAGAIAEKMRIDSNGNVGIGTSSPGALLHLSGTNPFIRFTDTVDSSHYAHIGHSDTSVFVLDADAANAHADSGIEFKVDNSSVMFLKNGGNVGIGTTSPDTELHVKGVGAILKLETTATTGTGYMTFNDADEEKVFIGLGSSADDSLSIWLRQNSNIRFATNNTERVRIDSSGRLLIGSTTGDFPLDVNGAARIAGIFYMANDQRIQWGGSNVSYIEGNDESHIAFGVAAEKMRLTATGLGIGTNSPTRNLHIKDTSPRIMLSNDNTGHASGDGTELMLDSGGNFEILQRENLNLEFFTNNLQRMTIVGGGNVGIGGTAPNYQLHVVSGIGVGAHGFAQQLSIGNNSIQSLILGTGYTSLSLNALGGNVGIGTTSPAATFHISKSYSAPTGGVDSNTCLLLSNSGGSAYAQSQSALAVRIS